MLKDLQPRRRISVQVHHARETGALERQTPGVTEGGVDAREPTTAEGERLRSQLVRLQRRGAERWGDSHLVGVDNLLVCSLRNFACLYLEGLFPRAEGGACCSSERIPWRCAMQWAMRWAKPSGVEDAGEGVVRSRVRRMSTLFFAHN